MSLAHASGYDLLKLVNLKTRSKRNFMAQSTITIIDGYNVLFQTPLMVADKGRYQYEISRKRLVGFVFLSMEPSTGSMTEIVFDSKQKRTQSPRVEQFSDRIRVTFASHVVEADQFIEDLIIHHEQPKSLWVVSSDGKIKSTARSFGVTSIDSRDWYERTLRLIPIDRRGWIQAGKLPPTFQSKEERKPKLIGPSRDAKKVQDAKNRARTNLTDDDLSQLRDFDDGV